MTRDLTPELRALLESGVAMDDAIARLRDLDRHPFSTLKAIRGVTRCSNSDALRRMHGVAVWRESVENIWATTDAFFRCVEDRTADSNE